MRHKEDLSIKLPMYRFDTSPYIQPCGLDKCHKRTQGTEQPAKLITQIPHGPNDVDALAFQRKVEDSGELPVEVIFGLNTYHIPHKVHAPALSRFSNDSGAA